MAFGFAKAQAKNNSTTQIAYTADVIDILYAHLVLALSDSPEVRKFAELMIQDHSAVNCSVEISTLGDISTRHFHA